MKTTLSADSLDSVFDRLLTAHEKLAADFPGESDQPQPIHTVYGGAQIFRRDSAAKIGRLAQASLDAYAPSPQDLATVLALPSDGNGLDEVIYRRVRDKLARQPVEDFRIDFEDGYGNRPDPEEDQAARQAALETARGMDEGTLPPFIGIRIKPFNAELHRRSIRTLDIYLSTLAAESGGRLPDNFVVTLPKVDLPEQVAALVDLFEVLEPRLGLAAGSLLLELMIETPHSIIDIGGRCNLPLLLEAARGRCRSAHFGVYDYTAACNVAASLQSMDHPVCDFARHMMQVAFNGTGVLLSDGATNILPVASHRASPGESLDPSQIEENRQAVHQAWSLGAAHIRHSLNHGFFQGWDLHPAQLPIRYGAVYAFFLQELPAATARLRNFIEKAAQATLAGHVFDDAATGQALLNFFLRGLASGAITPEEASQTGLTLEELRLRSFLRILQGRSG